MMDMNSFFEEMSANVALWCAGASDTGELARVAECASGQSLPMISAAPEDVSMLWAWLEKTPARIYARFYLPPHGGNIKVISDLAVQINSAFKHGAHGAQIFMRMADLKAFADEMVLVRDDLFFYRDLAVGIDISEIGPFDWPGVFDAVRRLRARALVLALTRDAGDKSDFVGRVYAAARAVTGCELHFVLGGNPIRVEQAVRMVAAIRPETVGGVRVFVPVSQGGMDS